MEVQLFDQEEAWPDSTPAITAKLFEMSKINNETKREIHYYSQETNSSSSCVSHLIYNEIPLGFSTVVGQFSIDEHHEENQLEEELMAASDYKTTDNPSNDSQTLSRPHPDKKAHRAHEAPLLKLKLKAIACSDFKCPSHRTNRNFQFGETADLEASSSEDDDIFTELPMSEKVFENLHKMYISQTKQGHIANTDIFPVMADSNPEEKKRNEHKMSLQIPDLDNFHEKQIKLLLERRAWSWDWSNIDCPGGWPTPGDEQTDCDPTDSLDLSAAFNTTDYGVFLNCLLGLGLRGIILRWFRSYLKAFRRGCLGGCCLVP